MTFKRARNEEQREIRRRAILSTAAAMLDEMPLADVSLNELSRRVGLAKSNVLRYFDSREAVLLELLDDFMARWLDELAAALASGLDAHATPEVRAGQLADVLSRSLSARVVLCDLFGAQGGVLEHNVSVEVVKQHKRSLLASLTHMAGLVRRHLPELGDGAHSFCLIGLLTAGALSSHLPPAPGLLAAYAEEPELRMFHMELDEALRVAFASALLGGLPRKS